LPEAARTLLRYRSHPQRRPQQVFEAWRDDVDGFGSRAWFIPAADNPAPCTTVERARGAAILKRAAALHAGG
jgi:hypothetical protein